MAAKHFFGGSCLCTQSVIAPKSTGAAHFSAIIIEHKGSQIRDVLTKHNAGFAGNFWPQFGGFSFYAAKSEFSVYGKSVARRYPEPDLHGTVMLTWALSELEALELSPAERSFGNLRP